MSAAQTCPGLLKATAHGHDLQLRPGAERHPTTDAGIRLRSLVRPAGEPEPRLQIVLYTTVVLALLTAAVRLGHVDCAPVWSAPWRASSRAVSGSGARRS